MHCASYTSNSNSNFNRHTLRRNRYNQCSKFNIRGHNEGKHPGTNCTLRTKVDTPFHGIITALPAKDHSLGSCFECFMTLESHQNIKDRRLTGSGDVPWIHVTKAIRILRIEGSPEAEMFPGSILLLPFFFPLFFFLGDETASCKIL